MRTFPARLLAAALLVTAVGCGDQARQPAAADANAGADRPLNAVATVGMVADVVRNVAGDHATVTELIGPGVDPHLYKPTRSDNERLLDADIIFYCGHLLEGRMTDALIRTGSAGKPVIAVTEAIDETYLLEPEGFEGHADPHVWMDPAAWATTVDVVRDRLAAADPRHADAYAAAAEAYAAQLAGLDAYAAQVLATVPESQRVLVTAHDAFNYFGRRYGFEVVGIQGLSTESEAGVKDIERLVDLIVERRLPAVFIESTVSERNITALVAGAASRGHTVVIGGELFSDAMGNAGTYEGTYIGMIDHNVTTIARALGGDAPPGGMQGKLAERPEPQPVTPPTP